MRNLIQRLKSITMSVETLQGRGLPYWRERVFGYTLAAMLLLGFAALLPSVWLSIKSGLYLVAVTDVVAYLLVFSLIFLRRRIQYNHRAAFLLVIGLFVGIVVFYFTGDEGGGLFWMFVVPPLASVLLGLQAGFFFFFLNFVFIVITGYLVVLEHSWLPGLIEFDITGWSVYAVNFLVTNALITFPLGALLNGLFETTKREKQMEQDYQALFQNNPLPMWVYDSETLKFVAVNETAVERYGYSRKEFLSMTIKAIRPPEEVQRLEESVRQLRREGLYFSGLWKHQKKNGEVMDVEVFSYPIQFAERDARLVLANDVTELMKSQLELRNREDLYRTLAENSQTLICTHDLEGRVLSVNDVAVQLTGYSRDQLLSMNLNEVVAPEWRKFFPRYLSRLSRLGKARGLMQIQTARGEIRTWEYNNVLWVDENKTPLVRGMATDVTERLQTQEQRKLSDQILQRVKSLVLVIDQDGSIIYVSPSSEHMIGFKPGELLGDGWWRLSRGDTIDAEGEKALLKRIARGELPSKQKPYERPIRTKSGEVRWIEWQDAMGPNQTLIGVGRDVTENKKSEQALRQRLGELEAIREVSMGLRSAATVDEMLPLLMDTTIRVTNADSGAIWLYDKEKDEIRVALSRGYVDLNGLEVEISPEKPGTGLAGAVFAGGWPHVSGEYREDPNIPEEIRKRIPQGVGGVSIPIRAETETIGVLVVNTRIPKSVEDVHVNLLTTLAEIAGNAIQRSTLSEKTQHQLSQFKALSEIDQAILSNLDLHYNLRLLVENVVQQLGADAANVMLFDPVMQTLESVQGTGFQTQAFERKIIGLGEGYAGKAGEQRKIIHVEQLEIQRDNPRLAKALVGEGFTSYYGIPLIAKGELRGVLEIFNRSPLGPDEEWFGLLNALASRAALAIDTIKVLENLERSNQDLTLSYDATIEGWSKALDLRDRETEGHSQRVTELGLELARRIGLNQKQLKNFRRGALLHDIGKMGVPDTILFKPGSLTDEEWVLMKQHTVFAQDMLIDIAYLREALEIPYSHHERWDGSGYPQGLKSEEIPLAARIFAVADVFDALTSDRPYRQAWTKEKTVSYIKEESGKLFDPAVVDVFLKYHLATRSLEGEKTAML
jgi:PAS domain S-box-containing protein/putative nucleotidyltransferase with HDIG domain